MPLANDGPAASEVLGRLRKAATVAIDVETSGLDPWKNYPIGYALTFSGKPEDSFYVPLRHAGGGNLEHGEERFETAVHGWNPAPFEVQMLDLLRGKRIVGHNLAFDLGFLGGIDTTQSKFNDTMVMAYLVNELRESFSLAECCVDEKVQSKKGDEIYKYLAQTLGVPERKNSMGEYWRTNANATIVHEYASGDGTSTWQLWGRLLKQIEEQDLVRVHQIESDLVPVLHRMRMRGIAVDKGALARATTDVELHCATTQAAVGDLNVRSSLEVKKYLERHGVSGWPVTEKGAPNFSEKWLSTNEPGRMIVAARKYRTLRDFFLAPLAGEHLRNGRVHAQYHQSRNDIFGTITARLSCSEPNLTQVPGKRQGERGKFFRSMFVPDEGRLWTEADFRACEIRIGAHYCKAPVWINGFAAGIDPHTAVADAQNIHRDRAKVITLGVMMGGGARMLSEQLGVSQPEAKAFLGRYYESLPELRALQRQASAVFERRGYIKSISGRRFRLDEPKHAFRAVNRLTQGGNADLLKSRLVEMDEVARAYPGTDLLLSVHDSISWQTANDEADRALRETMIGTEASQIKFDVPMEITAARGATWGAATFDAD